MSDGEAGLDIQVLFDRDPAPALTAAERRYGGRLHIVSGGSPHVFANFVSTLDGVVSLGLRDGTDSSAISGRHPVDRYVMAMLRAAAGAILIGAGTLRASPGHVWNAERLVPERRGELAEFRAACGLPQDPPPLFVVSGSGDLPSHPALDGATVITTASGAGRLARTRPGLAALVAGDGPRLDGAVVVQAAAEAAGDPRLLCEGGPLLMGTLLAAGAVNELFLSIAAVIAGRGAAGRPGLAAGGALPPAALEHCELRSARRSGDILLLRYRLLR